MLKGSKHSNALIYIVIHIYIQGLRMGRAGQHFELFDPVLDRVKEVTTHNHSLRVQYVR